jgi:hypothetical protein
MKSIPKRYLINSISALVSCAPSPLHALAQGSSDARPPYSALQPIIHRIRNGEREHHDQKRIIIMEPLRIYFNVHRDDASVEIIDSLRRVPNIGRCYPAGSQGNAPEHSIHPNPNSFMIRERSIDGGVRYSDVSHEYVMHRARMVTGAGHPSSSRRGQDHDQVKVPSSPLRGVPDRAKAATRRVSEILRSRTEIRRHLMPYGIAAQRSSGSRRMKT